MGGQQPIRPVGDIDQQLTESIVARAVLNSRRVHGQDRLPQQFTEGNEAHFITLAQRAAF
jgi:hypothetical protein